MSTVVSASPLTASTGLIVHRLAARAVIQDWENGCLATDSVEHEVGSYISLAVVKALAVVGSEFSC